MPKMFADRPHTLQDLKNNITDEIRENDQDVLQRVMTYFCGSLQECERRGVHLEYIIFKKYGYLKIALCIK